MFESTKALYAQLAEALGVETLPADDSGAVQLSIGDDSTVYLFAESAATLMLMSPVMALPKGIDYGATLWLLRRNFHDSPIAPFRVSCDTAGRIVLWGRIPVDGMTGENLAGLLDALGAEAELIRSELEIDDGTDDDAA